MTAPLAQALVDAAAKAMSGLNPLDPASWIGEARVAVAAVLETLAARGVDITDPDAWLSEHHRLLKLAAEIREGT